jgi:hypothetical protein
MAQPRSPQRRLARVLWDGSTRLGVRGGRLDQEEAPARRDERQGEHRDCGHDGEHGDGVLESGLHNKHSLPDLLGLGRG